MVASSVGLGLYLISNRIGQNEMSFFGRVGILFWSTLFVSVPVCGFSVKSNILKNLKLNNLLLFS